MSEIQASMYFRHSIAVGFPNENMFGHYVSELQTQTNPNYVCTYTVTV